ncbi:MAG: hypothetical protein WBL72_22155 [Thermoguttaceae bacterium]
MNCIHSDQREFDRRTCLKGVVGAVVGVLASDRLVVASRNAGDTQPQERQAAPVAPLSLEQSLRLAGQNLLAILDPEDNYLPYWELSVGPDYRASLQKWWPAHNIGRWWDAMMRLEEAIGFEIPKAIETAMRKKVRRFFDNPDHICLNPNPGPSSEGPQWDLHSLREGLLALNALARWRKDDWAAAMGRQMIESLDGKLRGDGSWDLQKFDACQKRGKAVIHNTDPCDTHGRLLEALVWFFETTGDAAALRLADRIAQFHFAKSTQADGAINPAAKADHTHSYLGTLRGLLLYGRLTGRHQYIDRVKAAYRVSIPRVVHESGYTSHNMVRESFGETTSPGDVAQLALWLYQAGYAEFLADAERLVRARILPSQIRTTPPLRPLVDDGKDAHRELDKRIIGGYGGCHGHAHGGKHAVTDVTSADVHTLVDIYKHVAVSTDGVLQVLFHFDYEDPRIRLVCRRGKAAQLSATPKIAASVALRVPHWTPRDSVRVCVDNKAYRPVFAGQFAWMGKLPAGTHIEMEYALPDRHTREKGLGGEYEIFWRGDDVIGIRPNTNFYPFYSDAPPLQQ